MRGIVSALMVCALSFLVLCSAPPSTADSEDAVSVARHLCDSGNFAECAKLGLMYTNSERVPKDPAKAVALLTKACDGGAALGCGGLGEMYKDGEGVPKDLAKAAALYQKACDGGAALGCARLGVMYYQGEGVPKDPAKAVPLLTRACDGGISLGCTVVGIMYERGWGVSREPATAAGMYKKACDGGHAAGCFNLARIRYSGEGFPEDQVAQHFKKACADGDAGGCVNHGLWAAKEKEAVAALFNKACDGGSADGCLALGEMHERGEATIGEPRDPVKAAEYFKKACDGGSADGCTKLGAVRGLGAGVSKELANAPQTTPSPAPPPRPAVANQSPSRTAAQNDETLFEKTGKPLLFVSGYLERDTADVPHLTLRWKNISGKTIDAYEFTASCFDRYGRPARHYQRGKNQFQGLSQTTTESGDFDDGTWGLYGYGLCADARVRLTSVHFNDGKVWKNNKAGYDATVVLSE